jgi:hypothetical protein
LRYPTRYIMKQLPIRPSSSTTMKMMM